MARDKATKRLRTRLREIERERQALRTQQSTISKQERALDEEIEKIETKLNSVYEGDWPVLTEHAILRYLERVEGLDIKAIERKIVPQNDPVLQKAFKTLGTKGEFPVGQSHKVVIENNKVVTVLV